MAFIFGFSSRGWFLCLSSEKLNWFLNFVNMFWFQFEFRGLDIIMDACLVLGLT